MGACKWAPGYNLEINIEQNTQKYKYTKIVENLKYELFPKKYSIRTIIIGLKIIKWAWKQMHLHIKCDKYDIVLSAI